MPYSTPDVRDKVVPVTAETHSQLMRVSNKNARTMKAQLAIIVKEFFEKSEKT